MSDISNAPPPSSSPPTPPAAPQPAPAHEVPINQNPVSTPQPIGSQAPERPPEQRHPSRRESIQRAFDKAETESKAKPSREKPGMGHNNPPEPTEKFDLKKPPPKDQPREQGRFAKAPAPEAPAGQQLAQTPPGQQQPGQQQQPARQYNPLPPQAPYRDPPPRFSEQVRGEWAGTPEGVRGEVHRMTNEIGEAYRRYRGDHETMNSIRHFHDMAQQHGTTLDRALTNYVGMEQKLRTDLIGGLDVIVNNLGLTDPQTGQKITMRDVAYHILNQSPEQHKLTQQSNAQTAASHQIGALHQEVTGLKSQLQQMYTAQQFGQTRSAVDQFADAHPRFDELGDLIEQELQYGFDLTTAYQRAELLRPATHAAQTRTDAPAQTRNAPAQTRNKSISGAPDGGPGGSPQSRPNGKQLGLRDTIQEAIRRVGG